MKERNRDMIIEATKAFYNEETGAVQPWRDMEVTDTLGNELIGAGFAREVAAGGGGGGGGDFTVVEMTVTVVGEGTASIAYPVITEFGISSFGTFTEEAGETTVGVILYQNNAAGFTVFASDESDYPANALTGTGDIEIDETGYVTVTGDCTLTVNTGA